MNKLSSFWSGYAWVVIAGLLIAMFLAYSLGNNLPLIVQTLIIFIWIAIGISLEWVDLSLNRAAKEKGAARVLSMAIGSLPYALGLALVSCQRNIVV